MRHIKQKPYTVFDLLNLIQYMASVTCPGFVRNGIAIVRRRRDLPLPASGAPRQSSALLARVSNEWRSQRLIDFSKNSRFCPVSSLKTPFFALFCKKFPQSMSIIDEMHCIDIFVLTTACWTWSDWPILITPKNEAFSSKNRSKLPVFSPLKFYAQLVLNCSNKSIKVIYAREIEHFRAANQIALKIFYLPKIYQCCILVNKLSYFCWLFTQFGL